MEHSPTQTNLHAKNPILIKYVTIQYDPDYPSNTMLSNRPKTLTC